MQSSTVGKIILATLIRQASHYYRMMGAPREEGKGGVTRQILKTFWEQITLPSLCTHGHGASLSQWD